MIQQLDGFPRGPLAAALPMRPETFRGNPAEPQLREIPPPQPPVQSQIVLDSFLMGATALGEDSSLLGGLSAGNHLGLRPTRQGRVEVVAPDGNALGCLPPDDAPAVVELMQAGACPTARVRCVVPAFRRPRVQLSIEVIAPAGPRPR